MQSGLGSKERWEIGWGRREGEGVTGNGRCTVTDIRGNSLLTFALLFVEIIVRSGHEDGDLLFCGFFSSLHLALSFYFHQSHLAFSLPFKTIWTGSFASFWRIHWTD